VFALDGQRFEIDLSDAHAARLREVFAPYIAAGRKTRTRRASTKRVAVTASRSGRAAGPAGSHHIEQAAVPQVGEAFVQPVQRSSATTDIPPRPLATVVPLPRNPRGQTGRTDIVARRQRLVAEMGELVRVVAVAMLAATADRLIGVIVRPAVSPAHGGKFEHSGRNDALDITASIVPVAPSSSSVAPWVTSN
jgi:hypothetical protein